MNNKKNILVTLLLCILMLIIGLVVGHFGTELFDNNNNIDNSLSDENSNIDLNNNVDTTATNNSKQMQLAMGRYLYFLAEAFYFNCDSSYFEVDQSFNVSNYGEILNNFTDNFKKENNGNRFDNNCAKKIDDNKYNLSGCWCGSGGPAGRALTFRSIKIIEASEKEISYSINIFERVLEGFEGKDVEYNDSFTIKYIDGMWKIDEYTYRCITNYN